MHNSLFNSITGTGVAYSCDIAFLLEMWKMRSIVIAHKDTRIVAALQEMLSGILEEIHRTAEVLVATSVEEAKEMIFQCGPTLVMIDDELPNTNDLKLIRSIHTASMVSVLMTKEISSKSIRKRTNKERIDDAIPKPLDREKVKLMLKRYLNESAG